MLLIIILALIGPFFLLPIEQVFGWPALFEEFFKLMVLLYLAKQILFVKQSSRKNQKFLGWAFVFGLFFASSETIIYFYNFFHLGDWSLLPVRLVFTTSMHVVTTLLIGLGILMDQKKGLTRLGIWTLLGLTGAMFTHYIFNSYFVPLISS